MVFQRPQKGIDQGKLFRMMGAGRERKVSSAVRRRVHRWLKRMDEFAAPKMTFQMMAVRKTNRGNVWLENGACLRSPKLAKVFQNAERACCFVATLGPGLDREINRCMKKRRYADAYVLDAIGSLAVEGFVDSFHRSMASRYRKRGKSVTLRFSPGYCDWPIDDQKVVFRSLQSAEPHGVNLNRSCLMTPQKSVSGVFGIVAGQDCEAIASYNPCAECRQKNCRARRIGRSDQRPAQTEAVA